MWSLVSVSNASNMLHTHTLIFTEAEKKKTHTQYLVMQCNPFSAGAVSPGEPNPLFTCPGTFLRCSVVNNQDHDSFIHLVYSTDQLLLAPHFPRN